MIHPLKCAKAGLYCILVISKLREASLYFSSQSESIIILFDIHNTQRFMYPMLLVLQIGLMSEIDLKHHPELVALLLY